MNNKYIKFLATAALLPAISVFGGQFVITDDACPAGEGELEVHIEYEGSLTTRYGKNLDNGLAIEAAYGVVDSLELAVAVEGGWNYNSRAADHGNLTGVSFGAKYQILDPEEEDAVLGLALVAAIGYSWSTYDKTSASDLAVEIGVNFQKNIGEDLVLALTPSVCFGWEKEDENHANAYSYGFGAGASYSLAEGLYVGFELGYEVEMYGGSLFEGALYAGPNVCFETEVWWVTACVAPRIFSKEEGEHDVLIRVELGFAF